MKKQRVDAAYPFPAVVLSTQEVDWSAGGNVTSGVASGAGARLFAVCQPLVTGRGLEETHQQTPLRNGTRDLSPQEAELDASRSPARYSC